MSQTLPPGWVLTTIGEVTTDAKQRQPLPEEEFDYIDISSIDRITKRVRSPQHLSGEEAPSRARKAVVADDVLVSMTRPNLNAVAMVPPELDGQIASTGFDVLRAVGMDARWLFYLVRSNDFVSAMSDLAQGALYPAIRSKDVRSYGIPFAPLNEQRRIANKLDALLVRVEACRTRLDRVPLILKHFRQAVLAAATSGRLTEDWRERLDHGRNSPRADSVLESTAEALEDLPNWSKWLHFVADPVFEYDGQKLDQLPDTWKWLRFGNVASVDSDLVDPNDYKNSPHIAPNYVESFTGRLLPYGTVASDEVTSSKHLFRPGQVLYSKIRPYLCKAVVVDFSGVCSADMYPISGHLVSSEYLHKWMISAKFTGFASSKQGRTVLPKINQAALNDIPVPVPPRREQREIVRRVEVLFAYADRLEARCRVSYAQVERLTPALLAKAFRGELVPPDPGDESAATLVEHIRATLAVEENNTQSRRKAPRKSENRSRAEVMMLKRTDIQPAHLSILLKASGPLTAEALWSTSQLEIDDFYDQLKDEEASGLLREIRDKLGNAPRQLEAA